MPLLKHAKKKLRQDKKRTVQNKKLKEVFKKLVKAARVENTPESLSAAFSSVDKAVKANLMHKNKAARIKSSLAKQDPEKATAAAPKKAVKKTIKKATPKKGKKTVTKKKAK